FQKPVTCIQAVVPLHSLASGGIKASIPPLGSSFLGAASLGTADGASAAGFSGTGDRMSITGFASRGSRCDSGLTGPDHRGCGRLTDCTACAGSGVFAL